ncbi:MAG TPA: hypothetical protein DDZ88_14545 [Verrucomicrobiales bacterium]|nr:hypothetical protein [Verrucomicrobiales bacterium]
MNLAENIAATYLRLNGFFLLPHFTVLKGDRHNHIDLLALRAAGAEEKVPGSATPKSLPVDDQLFGKLDELFQIKGKSASSKSNFIGMMAEVRSNRNKDEIDEPHISYVRPLFGNAHLFRALFFRAKNFEMKISGKNHDELEIDIIYASKWILKRIEETEKFENLLTKTKSWALSEPFLSDIMQLRDYGLLQAIEA